MCAECDLSTHHSTLPSYLQCTYVLLVFIQTGVLRFYGNVNFEAGLWAGVELNEPVGKHNGTVNGVQYFKCQSKHGELCGGGK